MTRVRAILVEDSADDAELLVRMLAQANVALDWVRVETAEALALELARDPSAEIVLADWFLPAFSGPSALALVARIRPELPVVVVSGVTGEHTAVLAIKAGARDFVLKDRPERLPFVILREVEAAAERAAAQGR